MTDYNQKISDIAIGDLKIPVTFQVNNPTVNTSGSPVNTYVDLLTTRCRFYNNSGNKRLESGEIVFQDSWQIITRFQKVLVNSIIADSRCRIDGKVYAIKSYYPSGMKNRFLIFNLSINNNG